MNTQQAVEVTKHIRKHGHAKVVVSTTLNPGFVSTIGPVPTICGPEIHCRPEDQTAVRQLIRRLRNDHIRQR